MTNKSTPVALSLSKDDAVQWNADLMVRFQAELERNPKADLMSLFSDSYRRQHKLAQSDRLSRVGQINPEAYYDLGERLEKDPELDFLSQVPAGYRGKMRLADLEDTRSAKKQKQECPVPLPDPDFCENLELSKTAKVVFPLSEEVTALLALPSNTEKALITRLKELIWKSPKLWEVHFRGVVVKCNDNIVAKVIWNLDQYYTEHTALEFLAKKLPKILIPRAHGLVEFGPFRVVFMDYVPGTNLAKAWPSMSHEEKLSIQKQLDNIFRQLRRIKPENGFMIGGVGREGAKDDRVKHFQPDLTTAQAHTDFQFSAIHQGSKTFNKLLRSFLDQDHSMTCPIVLTHGDARQDNIMVKQDSKGHYIVSGIIDWDWSGFYPAYLECISVARRMPVYEENDWYLYIPKSISPAAFPVRWLAYKYWELFLMSPI